MRATGEQLHMGLVCERSTLVLCCICFALLAMICSLRCGQARLARQPVRVLWHVLVGSCGLLQHSSGSPQCSACTHRTSSMR